MQIEEFGHEWKQEEKNEAEFTPNPTPWRKNTALPNHFPAAATVVDTFDTDFYCKLAQCLDLSLAELFGCRSRRYAATANLMHTLFPFP